MSLELSVDELTAQTTELIDVCVSLKNGVAQQIADAVIISQNASIIPLIIVATNLIQTQAIFINYTNNNI
jgi:hypothetical protein